jgi:hypothetical protein
LSRSRSSAGRRAAVLLAPGPPLSNPAGGASVDVGGSGVTSGAGFPFVGGTAISFDVGPNEIDSGVTNDASVTAISHAEGAENTECRIVILDRMEVWGRDRKRTREVQFQEGAFLVEAVQRLP